MAGHVSAPHVLECSPSSLEARCPEDALTVEWQLLMGPPISVPAATAKRLARNLNGMLPPAMVRAV